jgi:lipopolysaccharide transport system ATP-binding protein
MTRPAIVIDDISKAYRIGLKEEVYPTFREMIARAAKAPLRRLRDFGERGTEADTFWALRHVSCEVQPGEVVGIVGQNGAGKSTLLKILSRITEPTEGCIRLRGHVASLLEVGTGFHPELTGRENIYLNGSILGMRKAEIDRKFDEIVAFSEIEKFIDTPVKHYSSGMFVRLAFAVAAHLDPEILIVDEVLAVGDASFRKKCIEKMDRVAGQGRTVLFVSHDMQAVTRLCKRVIYLDRGAILSDGTAQRVVQDYLRLITQTTSFRTWEAPDMAPGNEVARLRSVRCRDLDGQTISSIDIREEFAVEMSFDVLKPDFVLVPNFHFFDDKGSYLFVALDLDPDWRGRPRPVGHYSTTIFVPGNFLSEGTVIVGTALTSFFPMRVHYHEQEAVAIHVVEVSGGDTARGDYQGHLPGAVRPMLRSVNKFFPSSDPLPRAIDLSAARIHPA